MRNYLILRLESSISQRVINFSGVDFFIFLSPESSLLKRSISQNIRKAFFWENIKKCLILALESFIFWNIRIFFELLFLVFLNLGLKLAQVAVYITTNNLFERENVSQIIGIILATERSIKSFTFIFLDFCLNFK